MIWKVGKEYQYKSLDPVSRIVKAGDEIWFSPNELSAATLTCFLPDGVRVTGNRHTINSPSTVFLMGAKNATVSDLNINNADYSAVKVSGRGNTVRNVTGLGQGWVVELLSAFKATVVNCDTNNGKARFYGLYAGGLPPCDGLNLSLCDITLNAAEHCLRLHATVNTTVGSDKSRMKLWNRNLPSANGKCYNGAALNVRDGANHLYQNIDCIGFGSGFSPLNLPHESGEHDVHGNPIMVPWDDGKRLQKIRVTGCTFTHEVFVNLGAGLIDIEFTKCTFKSQRQACVNFEGDYAGDKKSPQDVRFIDCQFFQSTVPPYPAPKSPFKGNLTGLKEVTQCSFNGVAIPAVKP